MVHGEGDDPDPNQFLWQTVYPMDLARSRYVLFFARLPQAFIEHHFPVPGRERCNFMNIRTGDRRIGTEMISYHF